MNEIHIAKFYHVYNYLTISKNGFLFFKTKFSLAVNGIVLRNNKPQLILDCELKKIFT